MLGVGGTHAFDHAGPAFRHVLKELIGRKELVSLYMPECMWCGLRPLTYV